MTKPEQTPETPPSRSRSSYIKFILFLLLIAVIILTFLYLRVQSEKKLVDNTMADAIPIVSTITVKLGNTPEEIILPGNVSAWHQATIYARTNGYIKKWFVDIGSHVKEGELLAIIESPEVDAQLQQAEADLKTAIANADLAKVTAERWVELQKKDFVSKQATDEKVSSAKALAAAALAAEANRNHLQELVKFEKVIAPFDGVITSRTTDVGALINEGSGTTALFKIVQANPLRIYVHVPQNYTPYIKPKLTVTLHFAEHPGRSFPAKLLETAKAIDPTTRTLLAQFVADNQHGELLAGGYTEVHFKLPITNKRFRIPVNTLLFRAQNIQVAVLDDQNRVTLRRVKISRDFGNEVEIDTGLKDGERIVLNPPDSLVSGQKVKVSDKKESY